MPAERAKKDTRRKDVVYPAKRGVSFFVSIRNRCCWHPNLLSDPFSSSSFQQLRLVLVVAYSSGRRG
jgi:hypothetical protein